jgi:hypothetical protein
MRVIESRRLRWAGCSACSVLVGKPEGRRPLERPSRRWKDNIKVDLREVGWGGAWTGSIWLRIGAVVGCCECGNEHSGFIKCGEYPD